ncbi:MAG: hypothetical protein NC102_08185 [Clostridium sp.]|nr:hypothetical protein [Clostridium sp.]
MNAAQRIEALVRQMHTNVKALSELCGYERPQAFYDIQKGKTRNISTTMCDKITKIFPRVNRVWLLTGEGNMLLPDPDSKPAKEAEEVKMVPLLHISALAGPIRSYYQDGEDYSDNERIPSPHIMAELAVPISGDSMEPKFPDGGILYIARINEAAFIPWGHAMVIDTENGVFIKNVMPDVDESYILAESDNPKYPAMRIPKGSIYGMYRVLAVSKTFPTM